MVRVAVACAVRILFVLFVLFVVLGILGRPQQEHHQQTQHDGEDDPLLQEPHGVSTLGNTEQGLTDDVVVGELPLVGCVAVVTLGHEQAVVVDADDPVDHEHALGGAVRNGEHHRVADTRSIAATRDHHVTEIVGGLHRVTGDDHEPGAPTQWSRPQEDHGGDQRDREQQ